MSCIIQYRNLAVSKTSPGHAPDLPALSLKDPRDTDHQATTRAECKRLRRSHNRSTHIGHIDGEVVPLLNLLDGVFGTKCGRKPDYGHTILFVCEDMLLIKHPSTCAYLLSKRYKENMQLEMSFSRATCTVLRFADAMTA